MIAVLRQVVILLVLATLIWLADALRLASGAAGEGPASGLVPLTLGFALLAAHLVGRVLAEAALPKITGYLLAGVVLGPHVLGLVSLGVRDSLQLINQVALGLIALTAGGELAIKD